MWLIQSFIVMFCISALYLIYKFLVDEGVSTIVILCYFFIMGLPLYLAHNFITINQFRIKWQYILLILLAAIIGYISNVSHLQAIANAPNPGYCAAIVDSAIILITFLSFLFFNSDLSVRKIIGCGLCLVGMIIIAV